MRKTRSDSVLDGLPENQRAVIARWLVDENLSLKDAKERAFQDFGLRVSHTALSDFGSRCRQQRMLDRISASATTANAVVSKFKENPSNTYDALTSLVAQLAFQQALGAEGNGTPNVETLQDLTNLVLSAQSLKLKEADQSIKRGKLELDLQKYKDHVAEKKQAIERELKSASNSGGVSAETLQRIQKELKLL